MEDRTPQAPRETRQSAVDLHAIVPPADRASTATPSPTTGPAFFVNRELSWLEFNDRVLAEARNPDVPLLERLKFTVIVAANLDEFFMVRVAGLMGQRTAHVAEAAADGLGVNEQLAAIAKSARKMFDGMSAALRDEILPQLAGLGVRIFKPEELDKAGRDFVRSHFRKDVLPVLTPLAIDPGHPFPHLRNRSLNLVALLSGSRRSDAPPAFAVVQVPGVIKRLMQVPVSGTRAAFVLLDDVIATHIGELFPGFRCLGAWPFRVVRNFDLSIDEEEAEDLLESVQQEVRKRDRGAAVRLTIDAGAAPAAVEMLRDSLGLTPEFIFPVAGPLAIADLSGLAQPLADEVSLRDERFAAQVLPPFRDEENLFEVIAKQDVLLHHPYESFDPVVHFIERSATDPNVLAIKMTLYRTSGDSPIIKALMRAAENGKQVTALVEIKARFDEENNIAWARTLEEAGVHVVYGLVGLKTHAKVALVVRREGDSLKRYVHLGTGNYNPSTARLYTDVSLFTSKADFGEDATSFFNLLTSCTAPPTWRVLTVAPLGLHERILGLIEREASNARAGKPARIVAKMNSLVDPDVILALYRAAMAGVEIDLIVRGICCLRPGMPGVSENIRVHCVVDRFLEHARLAYFEAGGAGEMYAASADWMPRNFQRRVEVLFPIEDDALKTRILRDILGVEMVDDVKRWMLQPDGHYQRVPRRESEAPLRSQRRFLELARETAARADQKALRDRPFVVRPIRNRPTKAEEPVVATTTTTTAPAAPDGSRTSTVPGGE